MIKYIRLITFLCLFLFPHFTYALNSNPPLTVELIAEDPSIQAGKPFWVAIDLHLADEWHAYWKNPGETGIALKIDWMLPSGFEVGTTEWPTPQRFDLDGIIGYGYEGDTVLLAQIIPPSTLENQKQPELIANVAWLVCSSTTCLPGKTTSKVILNTDNLDSISDSRVVDLFASARQRIPQKIPELSIERHEGMIFIHLSNQLSFQENGWEVNFFPEDQHHVDSSFPVEMHENKVIIKEQRSNFSTLQGVLVLKEKDASSSRSYSFALNHPIKDEHSAIASNESKSETYPTPYHKEFEGGFALALLFAFMGGIILNLMPCVLPVISFKIMGFIKIAGESRMQVLKHGLFFSLGVILSFWFLAGMMLILQAYGSSVGWGFQLQEPVFVAFLAALLLMVGLNMFGLFEAGLGFASWAGQTELEKAKKKEGLLNSFLSGILATAVATPCTGPFLGSAVGFAFTLSAPLALVIFTVLGLGMSFPYLLLSAFPSCLRYMPKPGPWMMTFKEIVGFVMLATVLWLVWIFGAQTSNVSTIILLAAFLFIAIACWIYGKWSTPVYSRLGRVISSLFAMAFLGLGGLAIITASTIDVPEEMHDKNIASHGAIQEWETFSPARLADLQKQGIPVLVDFTAKWCLICQANHLVLSQDDISGKLAEKGVVKMKADWTRSDSMITQELHKFGRNSVPLYVLYGSTPNAQPKILPQILTSEEIFDHLDSLVDNHP